MTAQPFLFKKTNKIEQKGRVEAQVDEREPSYDYDIFRLRSVLTDSCALKLSWEDNRLKPGLRVQIKAAPFAPTTDQSG